MCIYIYVYIERERESMHCSLIILVDLKYLILWLGPGIDQDVEVEAPTVLLQALLSSSRLPLRRRGPCGPGRPGLGSGSDGSGSNLGAPHRSL